MARINKNKIQNMNRIFIKKQIGLKAINNYLLTVPLQHWLSCHRQAVNYTSLNTRRSHRIRGTYFVQLRMPPARIPKVALRWTQAGKRKRGRPKTTWRKTVETELSEMGLSWGETQAIAKDETRWKRDIIAAPCPTGGNKD